MQYLYSKEEFLSIQNTFYDKINEILKENIIANLDLKINRNIFNNDFSKERLYTNNIREWIDQLNWLKSNIYEELVFTLAYDRTYDKVDKSLRGTIKFNYRQRYLRLVLYDIFSIRDKLAYLIHELFNRKIKYRKPLSFISITEGLNKLDIFKENITWINDDEFKLIKNIMNILKENKNIKILNNARNSFTHRSDIGIDAIPLISLEEIILENGHKYISYEKLEEQIKYEDFINSVLEVWKLFVDSLKKLIECVNLLKEEIEK
ncbi:hypothetical protein [Clostridium sporogenes]|uniref:hypothetical protein n=1 Tax=Clostridium sporogenes TaxID=1509 RepID=UPI0005EEBB81|nr:hypothetical protein [Clostridium sporogenes]